MRRDETYLLHILISSRRIVRSTSGVTYTQFLDDGEKQDSIVHRISNIGEIAKRISAEFKTAHPEVPWKKMAGMRDLMIHDYYRIDMELVWDTAVNNIPELICLLDPLIPPERP